MRDVSLTLGGHTGVQVTPAKPIFAFLLFFFTPFGLLAVPKMGQFSESETLPECKKVLWLRVFLPSLYKVKIKFGVVKLLDVPQNGTDVPMWDIP